MREKLISNTWVSSAWSFHLKCWSGYRSIYIRIFLPRNLRHPQTKRHPVQLSTILLNLPQLLQSRLLTWRQLPVPSQLVVSRMRTRYHQQFSRRFGQISTLLRGLIGSRSRNLPVPFVSRISRLVLHLFASSHARTSSIPSVSTPFSCERAVSVLYARRAFFRRLLFPTR